MSCLSVEVVDLQSNNIRIKDFSSLTQTALGSLLYECKLLLDKLEDAEDAVDD